MTAQDDMVTARAAIEVHAGLIPGQPIEGFTRHWWITSAEWQQAIEEDDAPATAESIAAYDTVGQRVALLIQRQGEANTYAQYLMLQPDRVNWVKVEWIWF